MSNATTTAVYVRISEDRLGLELGIDRQRGDCLDLCERRGWAGPAEFADNDLTAATGAHRPQYAALVAAIERGEITRAVVWHPSRIWRNRRERADGIELFKKHKITLACVKGPELDLSNAYGRLAADLFGAFDSSEGEIKAERVLASVRQRAAAGKMNGTGPQNRLYGFTVDGLNIIPAEATRVRDWFARFLAGESVASLAKEAGVAGTPMRNRLRNPRYAAIHPDPTPDPELGERDLFGLGRAIRRYGGKEFPAAWPAIVDRATWEAACRILADPTRTTNGGASERKWLGSGLFVCERCGRRVYSSRGKAGQRVYRCRPELGGCSRLWDITVIDTYVNVLVRERLGRGDLADLLPKNRPDLAALRDQAAGIRSRIKTARRDFLLLGAEDEAEMVSDIAAARERLAEIERKLGDADRGGALGQLLACEDPVALWDSLRPEQVSRRQAIVRALMTITLGPAPRGNRGKKTFEKYVAWYGERCLHVGPPTAG